MRFNNRSKSLSRKHAASRLVVGLMSGTSMDGIDAALVRISGRKDQPRVRLVAFDSTPYMSEVHERLRRVAGGDPTCAAEISQLNFLLGKLFADAALRVCNRASVSPNQLAIIGSHGQTIYHQGSPSVEPDHPMASTLQIAEAAVIAHATGVPVVADFRAADIAAGGQGAPLVPMVDYLLLRDRRLGTAALNIGGIANVTIIPPGAAPDEVFGFDTGPGNMLMDALVQRYTKGRQPYDAGGRVAALGRVNELQLRESLAHPFFQQPPPRSAGREQFGESTVVRYFLTRRQPLLEDLVRTALELTARTIQEALERFVFPKVKVHRLIVSGGGAHNRLLMRRLRQLLPQLSHHLSNEFGLPVDAKEAIAFAVLADRTLHGLPGNLPSVTGARREVFLGKLVRP